MRHLMRFLIGVVVVASAAWLATIGLHHLGKFVLLKVWNVVLKSNDGSHELVNWLVGVGCFGALFGLVTAGTSGWAEELLRAIEDSPLFRRFKAVPLGQLLKRTQKNSGERIAQFVEGKEQRHGSQSSRR